MTSDTDIDKNLTFLLEGERDDRAIAYQIAGGANGEASDGIVVVYNPSNAPISVDLPDGEWGIYVQGDKAGNELLGTATGSVSVGAVSCTILVKIIKQIQVQMVIHLKMIMQQSLRQVILQQEQ